MTQDVVVVITAIISSILGPTLVLTIKHYLDNRKPKNDIVVDALSVSEKVMHKVDYVKEHFEADRVWVSQFHNGGNFYPTGKSIAKFSIVYETVNLDVVLKQTAFKNIPVSLFSKFINRLLSDDVIEIEDYKKPETATYGLKYIAEQDGTKSSYLFAIKTIDEKFIGILGVEYTKKKVKLNEDDVNHLSNHATAIGGVLNTQTYKG